MEQGRMRQPGTAQSSAGGRPQFVGRTYPTRNCLPEGVRAESIDALNRCLFDAIVVHSQLKFAHWNVKGQDFYQLHELFDELAETLSAHVDTIAERATALGGQALGTVRFAAQSSSIPVLSMEATDEWAMLDQIAANLAAFDATLYAETTAASERDDLDTADLLNEVSRDVSKALGFVEAHGQEQSVQQSGEQAARQRANPTAP